ncbi:hypothetical protein RLT85_13275 [Mesonia ostreae]|uniref:Uncharacterized protein n=2 Tax=Mesonia ostreae TaxID=861110 RepID=A0ABU2KLL4_9FLAO|nr:hypothetical protein [Mesonia ostreae]MDT0295606.1 hypothetical protein [Mesonia ostreae]
MRGSSAQPILQNGILVFNNEIDFENFISFYIDEDLTEIYDVMEPFYGNGFYSLRPPAVEGYNEEKIITQYQERVINFKTKYNINNYTEEQIYEKIDETTEIVLLDIFAAIISDEGELQIADNFYKFTDAGLFAVKTKDSLHLKNYLDNAGVANNLLNKTSNNLIKYFYNNFAGDSPVNVDGKVYYSGTPDFSDQDGGAGGGGGGGNYNPPNNPGNGQSSGSLDGLTDYLSNRNICYGSQALIGQIFGDHRVCINKYSSRRRVRTEVYNYNFGLPFLDVNMFIVGVKNKHQRKIAGGWFRKKADVVALGVELFQAKFDYSSILSPNVYQGFNTNAVSYSYNPLNISYNVNTNIWSSSNYPDVQHIFNSSYPNYPSFFQDGLVVEGIGDIYIGNLIQSGINDNLVSKKLNEQFWDNVYRISKNQLQGLVNNSYQHPGGVSLISNYPNQGVVMLQKTYYSDCNNCRKRNKTLLFGASGGISVSYNGNTGKFNYDMSASGTSLVSPQKIKFVVYGATKNGGNWHGNKMEANFN